MNYSADQQEAVSLIAEMAGLDVYEIDPSTKFSDLAFDSLDSMDLIYQIEEKFDIKIDDKEIDKINMVEDILKLLPS